MIQLLKNRMALLDPGKQHSNAESIFSALEKFKIQTELKRTQCVLAVQIQVTNQIST